MDVIPLWSVWLAAASVLLIAELLTGTFFLICFGMGAAATALVAGTGIAGGTEQWVVFLVVSAVSVFYSRHLAELYTPEPSRLAGVDRLLGKDAVVIERVDSREATGRIRVLHEDWRAQPADDESFEVDELVTVTGVRGTHLLIGPRTQAVTASK